MSEVQTQAGPADPAPAPAPVPAPQPTTAPPAGSTDVEAKLKAAGFEGNLDAVISNATEYRRAQRSGVFDHYKQLQEVTQKFGVGSPQALLAELMSVEPGAGEESGGAPSVPGTTAEERLTRDDVAQVVSQSLMQMQEGWTKQQQQAATQAARQAEEKFVLDTLRQGGYEVPDQGDLPPMTEGLGVAMMKMLNAEKVAGLPPYATDAEKQAARTAPTTQAQFDAAKAKFVQMLKTYDAKAVDRYAEGQEGIHDSVIGGPSSGATPPRTFDPITSTNEQRREFVKQALRKHGIDPDEWQRRAREEYGLTET